MSEILDYTELIEERFLDLYNQYCIGVPANRIPIIIDTFWKTIYNEFFRPGNDEKRQNKCNSRILPFHVYTIESIIDTYISLNGKYGGFVKIENIINLLGYTRETLHRWNKCNKTNDYIFKLSHNEYINEVNSIIVYCVYSDHVETINNFCRDENIKELSLYRYDILKKIRETIKSENDNQLSCSTVGQVVRANNDIDVGKMYDAKNIMLKQAATGSIETAADRAKRLGIELKSD